MSGLIRNFIVFAFTIGILSFSTYLVIPNYRMLVNLSSLGIVLGGSFGVMLMSTPLSKVLNLLRMVLHHMTNGHRHQRQWIHIFEKMSEKGMSARSTHQFKSLSAHPLYQKALSMVEQGMSKTDLCRVLERTSQFSIKEKQESILLCRTMAKYPPALGMIGTVIGLVGLLYTLQSGAGGETIGPGMALALLTTLYGLCVSNLIILPISDAMESQLQDWLCDAEMILKGFSLVLEDSPTLVISEELRAFLPTSTQPTHQETAA